MAGRFENQDPASPRSCVSDCESSVSGPVRPTPRSGTNPLLRLDENSQDLILLKHRLYSTLGCPSKHCLIVSAFENTYATNSAAHQREEFRFATECMAEKRCGEPNIKFAWYGSSRDGVGRIIRNGFTLPESASPFGIGLYLSPENCAMDSIATSTIDRYGLRHLVLCKVILGNTEQILLGSRQSSPSSEEFDSGVDDLLNPKRYIIWKEQMKTHILPVYVLSIKMEHCVKGQEQAHEIKKPSSPWIPLGMLVSMLSSRLPTSRVCMIKKFHNGYLERKLTRHQLIRRIREVTGDRLLIAAIKAFQDKQMHASPHCPSIKNVGKHATLRTNTVDQEE